MKIKKSPDTLEVINIKSLIFKICVFKTDIENDEIRKNMEQDLINRLNTNKIRCINKITSKKSKKFVFK